jgi:hypothetical protein
LTCIHQRIDQERFYGLKGPYIEHRLLPAPAVMHFI